MENKNQKLSQELRKEIQLQTSNITFKEVGGIDYIKEKLDDIVSIIKHQENFKEKGMDLPRGILIKGSSGIGKSLITKAIVGEIGIPFLEISIDEKLKFSDMSDSMFVDSVIQGALRAENCMIIIEDIDELCKKLNYEMLIKKIFVQLKDYPITVIMNKKNTRDEKRVFDNEVGYILELDEPNKKGRIEIFKICTRNKNVSPKVSFAKLSNITVHDIGRDIKRITELAVLISTKNKHSRITQTDFEKAISIYHHGDNNSSCILSPEERRRVAYHEAGHALAILNSKYNDGIEAISIFPHIGYFGVVWSNPNEKHAISKKQMLEEVKISLSGIIAEKIKFGTIHNSGSQDLQKAKNKVMDMIGLLGMDEKFGPVRVDWKDKGTYLSNLLEKRARKLLKKLYKQQMKFMTKHVEELDVIVKELLKKGELSEKEVKKLLK